MGSSHTPATIGNKRIIKAISSVVKPPTGGFFVFVLFTLFHLSPYFYRLFSSVFLILSCLTRSGFGVSSSIDHANCIEVLTLELMPLRAPFCSGDEMDKVGVSMKRMVKC